jgi:hypothetical protein
MGWSKEKEMARAALVSGGTGIVRDSVLQKMTREHRMPRPLPIPHTAQDTDLERSAKHAVSRNVQRNEANRDQRAEGRDGAIPVRSPTLAMKRRRSQEKLQGHFRHRGPVGLDGR